MRNLFTEFRDIKGFEGKYKVTEDGGIYSVLKDSFIKTYWAGTKRQYEYVTLGRTNGKRNKRLVHRLVCEAFHGPAPEGHDCCHNDGNPSNNHYTNLRWATRRENLEDRKKHGTMLWGERVGTSKLTEKDVLDIRKKRKEGHSLNDLAEAFGVERNAISRIVRGLRWAHIPI